MWMEELPNGKYKFFERYKDPYTEKLKKVSVTLEKKTPQARNQAAVLLQEKINKKISTKQVESITFEEIYNLFLQKLKDTNIRFETGEFGQYMRIVSENDGPVNLILSSDL